MAAEEWGVVDANKYRIALLSQSLLAQLHFFSTAHPFHHCMYLEISFKFLVTDDITLTSGQDQTTRKVNYKIPTPVAAYNFSEVVVF